MSSAYLPEVSEADANGRVAEIYEEIRRSVGMRIVNLIYRHLAVEPKRLEAVWGEIRPNLSTPGAKRLVDRAALPGVTRVSLRALGAIGVDGEKLRLARSTLDAYARANSRNLVAMQALIHGCPGGPDERAEELSPTVPILPIPDLSTLPPTTLALLDEMSAALVGAEEPRLVPSLLRHFAADAPLLALMWTALQPAAADLEARRLAVAAEAQGLLGRLPYPVSPSEDPAFRETAGRFVVAMSTMLVAGEGFRAAIG